MLKSQKCYIPKSYSVHLCLLFGTHFIDQHHRITFFCITLCNTYALTQYRNIIHKHRPHRRRPNFCCVGAVWAQSQEQTGAAKGHISFTIIPVIL